MAKATVASLEARIEVLLGHVNVLEQRLAVLEAARAVAHIAPPRNESKWEAGRRPTKQPAPAKPPEAWLVERRAKLEAARKAAMESGEHVVAAL
jgi:hypothetical protein